MRRLLTFDCNGDTLAATLDGADGATGLVIVSGGTEIRSGAHGGMARLARRVAAAGFPVLRFDRRGVGDSGGDDPGYAASGPDLAAATALLRAECPGVTRIAGFGLCDGATALALHHRAAGIDALLLANPWVVEPASGLPPPAAIRRRYAERVRSRDAWAQLATGRIDLAKAVRGVAELARPARRSLAQRFAAELGATPATILLAEDDATAIAFRAARLAIDATINTLASASHSFAGDGADWLADQVIAGLG